MHSLNIAFVLQLSVPMAAEIAQLGERVTEDHKVPGSIPGFGTEHPAACPFFNVIFFIFAKKYLVKKEVH